MSVVLFASAGGQVALPDRKLVLVDRRDGGNLVVHPPREVWERGELGAAELTHWQTLVAAAGQAMLDGLRQLRGGCVNYWEAGNWALHDDAEPRGPKEPARHRRVHLHLLGRSRSATDAAWAWGEAPRWPSFADRHAWAARFERLTPDECDAVVARIGPILLGRYGADPKTIAPTVRCAGCGYPTVSPRCVECGGS